MVKLPRPPSVNALQGHEPEVRTISTEVALWRIHRTDGANVTGWNQLRKFGPLASCRFDPHEPPKRIQDEGVAYLAVDVATAVAEVFQLSRHVNRRRGAPYLCGFHPARDLTLLDLTGGWPLRIGASHVLNTGRKDHCRLWARAFRAAWPEIDGLVYTSAMTGRDAVALFTPASDSFPDRPGFSLPLMHPDLAADLGAVAEALGYRLL